MKSFLTNKHLNISKINVESTTSGKVDINKLLLKVRQEERKERKENIFLFGLVGSVVISLGIIASL